MEDVYEAGKRNAQGDKASFQEACEAAGVTDDSRDAASDSVLKNSIMSPMGCLDACSYPQWEESGLRRVRIGANVSQLIHKRCQDDGIADEAFEDAWGAKKQDVTGDEKDKLKDLFPLRDGQQEYQLVFNLLRPRRSS